jgi:flagellar hook-basal body complex protein FliE
MNMTIGAVNPIQQAMETLAQRTSGATSGGTFQGLLEGAINRVEDSRAQAESIAREFISGENVELHSVALATQRAELEFDLLLEIRNKAIAAYQEVMRAQL